MNSDYYINLHFNQAIPQKTGYAFKIGDKGCTFHLHCVDLNPTGMNPHIVFNHTNGTCVEGVPTGSGQDYVYVIQGNEFGVCGLVVCDMKFYDSSNPETQRISTASFTFDVIADTLTPFDEASSSYADSLEHAREEIDAAILELQGAEADLGEAVEDLDDMSELFGDTLQDYIDAFGNTAPINPKGVYDATETYHPRDAVSYTHNGRTLTYMNMRQSTGVAPTDTDYWQVIIDVSIGGTFSALDDVNIDNQTLADGQVSMWDDTAGKWENKDLPAIVDNLNSTDDENSLSANMGHTLGNNLQHENLLHNAYFMGGGSQQGNNQFPINNEGLTSYPVGSAWGIDGWDIDELNDASMNILSDGIVIIHANVAGTYTFRQYIDNYEQYIGKTLTVSFLGTLLEGTSCNIVIWYHPFSSDWRGEYLTTSFSDGLQSLTFTVPNDATGLAIMIAASGANQPYKLKLQAAKLELGSMQTLAHQENGTWVLNDAPPDFALELAKCQTSVANPYDPRANRGNLSTQADLSNLRVVGTKNTTGATIYAGTYFYLNGQYCRVIQDISNNADFTLNTNYVVTSLGGDLKGKYIYETSVQFNAYADGVKTNQTLINDVMSQLQSWVASHPNHAYQYNFMFLSLNSCTPYDLYLRTAYADMSFKGMGLTPTDFFFRVIIAKTSASESYRGVGVLTITDESYEVATNDVSLIINVYQIL